MPATARGVAAPDLRVRSEASRAELADRHKYMLNHVRLSGASVSTTLAPVLIFTLSRLFEAPEPKVGTG